MTWVEKSKAGKTSGGKGLSVTLVCGTAEASAHKIYYLANHPDIEKLYVIPMYETFGSRLYGVSGPVLHNYNFFRKGVDLGRTEDGKPFVPAIRSRSFSGYEAKQLLRDYRKLCDERHILSRYVYRLPPTPDDLTTTGLERFIGRAMHAHPLQEKLSDEEVQNIAESLYPGGIGEHTIRRMNHRPIPFDVVRGSDAIICDIKSGPEKLTEQFGPLPLLNEAATHQLVSDKDYLPTLAQELDAGRPRQEHLLPLCTNVRTPAEVDAFMRTHALERIVLKTFGGARGDGIYKVARHKRGHLIATREYKDDSMWPSKPVPRQSVISLDELLEWQSKGMLAMEWLEPHKGDVRILCMNGEILGAYKRIPGKGSELCNHAQGGGAEPYEITAEERERLRPLLTKLKDMGQHWVGLDWMAGACGRRFLSEINVGNVGGLSDVQDFELAAGKKGKLAGECYADAVVAFARAQRKAPQQAIAL